MPDKKFLDLDGLSYLIEKLDIRYGKQYEHNITITNGEHGYISLQFISSSETEINSYSSLANALYSAGFRNNSGKEVLMASGYWTESSDNSRIVCSLYATSSSSLGYYFVTTATYDSSSGVATIKSTGTNLSPLFSSATISSSGLTVKDFVR